jgi:hypothetical protein
MEIELLNNKVYLLHHVYERDDFEDEVCFIGVFSSHQEALKIAKLLYHEKGFKDHPFECFEINGHTINVYSWASGFSRWDDDSSNYSTPSGSPARDPED